MIFLMTLIKCQDYFDYSELYELLFTISKIATDNYNFIEHLKCELEEYEQWSDENLSQSLNIYLAYREVVSCLTYLSAYQPVKKQLANYNRLFDASSTPFITLKEEIPLSPISCGEQTVDLLQKLGEDVELHFNVSIGAVECVTEPGRKMQMAHREDV
jgi:hypothetical protein